MATTMNISLPETLRDFVEREVADGGYGSVSEYMRELVRAKKSEKEIEDALLKAVRSKSLGEITPEFFDRLREHARRAVKSGRR